MGELEWGITSVLQKVGIVKPARYYMKGENVLPWSEKSREDFSKKGIAGLQLKVNGLHHFIPYIPSSHL